MIMATKTCKLNIPERWFMSWFVTTQAGNKVTVKLVDSKKTYFEKSKQSTDIEPPLAVGYGFVEGTGLNITIDVPASNGLKGEPHVSDVLTTNGDLVGKEFVMCLEDWTDNDYNDIAININAWRSKN
jgi:hypothetical protein